MKATTPIRRRNLRTFVAALLSYLMLAGQVAPLALASTRPNSAPPATAKAEAKVDATRDDATRAVPVPAPLIPITAQVTATMTGAITTDADSDGKADPGVDTITYTATITNNSGGDLSGLQFTDTVDSHTTLVSGSATAAADDRYQTIGNVNINVAAPGVLSNDFDPDTGNNTGMTVVSYGASTGAEQTSQSSNSPTTATAQGGTVSVNTDGSFTFDPKTGFTGTDTFKYVSASGGKTATATVAITVSGMIWFINNAGGACSANCDGRLSHPFTSLSNFQAVNGDAASGHPQNGDSIFLYESGIGYTGPVTLRNNQKFIGQDATASLETITGLSTPSGQTVLPAMNSANGTIATINASASNGINLGQGNTIRGLTISGTTGAKISGSGFGTLLVGDSTTPDVSLSGGGQALTLTNGTFANTSGFAGVASTSSAATGVTLDNVSVASGGTVSFGSTSTASSTAEGILVKDCTTTNSCSGTIAFGNTQVTGGSDGVSLTNNNAGTRSFGTLGVSGSSASAFKNVKGALANGGGSVTVTGAATLSSAGSAVNVADMVASSTINFQSSVSATSTGSGNAGVSLSGSNGAGATLTFNSLTVQTNAGAGMNLAGGGTVNVTNGTGTVNNTTQAASAIIANGVVLNANFSSINSSGGTNGVSLTNVSGTSNFGTGALSGASGATFLVNNGTCTVTYSGNVTQANNAPVVSVSGGHGTGTITFQTGTISATNGTGFQFDNADGTYNFNGTNTLNGGDAGVDILDGSAGTISFSSNSSIGATTSPTGIAFNIDGTASAVTASVTYAGTIKQTGQVTPASAVVIKNKTGGTATFSGAITASTGTANAIDMPSGNSGSTVTFSGGLSLTTTSGVGFNAAGGGTVNATQDNSTIINTLTTGTGTALNVANTTIGASGITFRSITAGTAGSGPTNAIILNNTGATAGLTVTGNGGTCTTGTPTCTGGTIQQTDQGALFTSTKNLSLSFMRFLNANNGNGTCNNADDSTFNSACKAAINMSSVTTASFSNMLLDTGAQVGINGQTVSGLTISNSTVQKFGNAVEENDLRFFNLTGTCSFTGSTFQQPGDAIADIRNNTGTLTLTIDNTTFNDTTTQPTGSQGLDITGISGAVMTVNIGATTACTFTKIVNAGYQVIAKGTSTINTNVLNSNFDPQTASTGRAVDLSAQNTAQVNFNVNHNTHLLAKGGSAVNIFGINSATLQGRIDNNTDIEEGGVGSPGTAVNVHPEDNATGIIEISGNTISKVGSTSDAGIHAFDHGDGASQVSPQLDVTIANNNITLINNGQTGGSFVGGLFGIWLEAGANTGDTAKTCGNVHNNAVSATPAAINNNDDIAAEFREGSSGSNLYLLNIGSGADNQTKATNTWNNNTNTPTGSIVALDAGGAPLYSAPPAGTPYNGQCRTPQNATAGLFVPVGDADVASNVAPADATQTATATGESAATLTASAAVEGATISAISAPAQATDTASTNAREWSDIPASRADSDARQVNASYADDSSREGFAIVNTSYEPAGGNEQAAHAPARVKARAATAAAAPFTSCSPSGINNAGTAICVDLPTIHDGDSVQITFQVTVNNLPNLSQTNPAQVSNHGTVTGSFTGSPLDTNTVNTPVDRFLSKTTLVSNNNPASQGDTVTFTATVAFDTAEVSPTPATPTTPTGTVDFIDTSNGNAVVCSGVSLSGGTAQCPTNSLSASTHNIQATYNGDGNYDPSNSNVVAQQVVACSATQTVTSTADDGTAGTLRYAVAHVCTNGTVNFQIPTGDANHQNGAYTITLGASGEIPVGRSMTIAGPNTGNDTDAIVVSGNDQSRVFNVAQNLTVSISNLTATHGSSTDGGAIVNNEGSRLTLTNVTVTNSTASDGGGGIANICASASPTLILEGSTVSGNTSTGNVGGGGIYTECSGTLYVDNSTVDSNHSTGTGNTAYGGGGISVNAGAKLSVSNSTVSNNTASKDAGGIYAANSTASQIRLINSTVSGNTANGNGGGLYGRATLVNTTVTNNRADSDGDNSGTGGGLYINTLASSLLNSIVAGNFVGTGTTSNDIDTTGGGSATGSNNLVGTGGAGGLVNGTNGNQVGVADAKLGALASNGGPTKTHALLAGSPAIDAGTDVTTLNGAIDNATTSVTVTDATAIPDAVGFVIQIDDEQMSVTARSGNTLTVARGANSTTPASHNDQAAVNPAFDQRGTPFHRKTDGNGDSTVAVDVGAYEVQPPTAVNDSYSTNEDTALHVNAPGVLSNDTGTGTKTAALGTGPAHASSFTLNSDGSFDYTPASNFNGQDSFTYTVTDSGGGSASATVQITVNSVNDAPTTSNNTVTVLEDHTYTFQTSDFPFADASDNPPNTLLNVIVTSAPAAGTLADNGTPITGGNVPFAVSAADLAGGKLTFAPAANANGAAYASFNFEVQDNGGIANSGSDTSTSATMTVDVTAVNDPPSFTKGTDQTVLEDAGAQTVTNWATNISAGPADESGQSVTFHVTNNTNTALFSSQPAVDSSGTLTYTPAANANGSATITLTLQDNGGTANGGNDTSAPQTFVINVTAVNDPPSFTKGNDQTVNEDAGAQTVPNWATNISAGPADESGQTLTFNVTGNTNTALFSAQPAVSSSTGTLSYTPAANAFGSATITLTLSDNGGTANGGKDTSDPQSFTITVNPVADTPSVTDATTNEDTQSTSGLVISRNAADGSEVTNFKITNIQHGTLFQNDGTTQINSGDFITYAQGHAGLKFTPSADFNDNIGTASFNVQASLSADNSGLGGGTATATIHVNAVNDAPSFTKGADQNVLINAGAQTVSGWATNIAPGPATATDESGQTLNFIVTNNNNGLFSAQPAVSSSGTLTYTPASNTTGQALVSVSLHDNGGTANNGVDTSAVQTFQITVGGPPAKVLDAKATEPATGTAKMIFTVVLANPLNSQTATIDYATADDSGGAHPATSGTCGSPGVDYQSTSGTLTFSPGETIKTVEVTICADGDAGTAAPDETLKLNLSNPSNVTISRGQATGTITHTNAPGTFIISEIRTSGPGGSADEFVELYNNTDTQLTVAASDASGGYGVFKMGATCADAPVLVAQIPNGTVIPARGHYLLVGSAYSLSAYAAGDQTMTSDIENDRNVALFTTSDASNISTVTRLDAVGFGNGSGGICDLFREGTTLPSVNGSTEEYSFFRKECDLQGSVCAAGGLPKDTNDNSADFLFADTSGTDVGAGSRLGAPGPENKTSPINRNSTLSMQLLDSGISAAGMPNRDREPGPANQNPITAQFGTLSIRRRVVNNTGGPVTRLRFRVIEITTLPDQAGIADLRAVTSSDVDVINIHDTTTCQDRKSGTASNCTVTVKGTTLEQPPNQAKGGGYNSTWSVNVSGLPGGNLPNNQSVEVQLQMGVMKTGNFRILVIVEALP